MTLHACTTAEKRERTLPKSPRTDPQIPGCSYKTRTDVLCYVYMIYIHIHKMSDVGR